MTRKRKLDPKIIRAGDIVQIDNPEMFVRCGYPLCLKDMYPELEEKFGAVIRDLVNSVATGDEFVRSDKPYTMSKDYFGGKESMKRSKIYRELAYHRLQHKKFGGNRREIHTECKERYKGARAEVLAVGCVKTGVRVPGYGGYDYYYGAEDYEPPYLDDQKTHKILRLGNFKSSIPSGQWSMSFGIDVAIEAIHVTKLYDKADVERVCGMIEILDQERKKEEETTQ